MIKPKTDPLQSKSRLSAPCLQHFVLLLGAVFSPIALATNVVPLECPPGLKQDFVISQTENLRYEWCVDSKGQKQGQLRGTRPSDGSIESIYTFVDDKMHGPAHLFAPNGDVIADLEFENGVEKKPQINSTQLENLIKLLNEQARSSNQLWQISLIGPKSVRYTVKRPLKDEFVTYDANDYQQFAKNFGVCAFIHIAENSLENIEMRYLNVKNEIAHEYRFDKVDCR